MTTRSDRSTLRARSPGDLLALIPYLLGYHPRESLVLAVVAGSQVRMCARLDLAEVSRPGALASAASSLADSPGASAVIAVAFGADQGQCRTVLDAVLEAFAHRAGLEVVEAIHADGGPDGGRWWSRSCTEPCCPAEGTPYDPGASRIAAEAVYAGLSVADGREAVAASVAGPGADEWPRLEERVRVIEAGPGSPLPAGTSDRQRLIRRLVETSLGPSGEEAVGGEGLGEDRCLELALLVREVRVRDVAWSLITPELAELHVRLWRQVVGRCPPGLACAPLCLVGVAAWISGNGTLQMCCVERVARLDPTCSMAELLAELNRRAVPPDLWADIAGELRSELDASIKR